MIKDVQEKKISFYTAECMEFETMGEVTECATLKEAFRIYQKMEQKRSGMGVGIGFILHDPDVPEYSGIHYPLSFRYDEDAKICLTHHVYGRSESGFVYIDVF